MLYYTEYETITSYKRTGYSQSASKQIRHLLYYGTWYFVTVTGMSVRFSAELPYACLSFWYNVIIQLLNWKRPLHQKWRFLILWRNRLHSGLARLNFGFLDHTQLDTRSRKDSSEREISSSQRPLPTQNTTNTRHQYIWLRRNSNPQSQQSSGRRLMPSTALSL
jgi:hypothetical protein